MPLFVAFFFDLRLLYQGKDEGWREGNGLAGFKTPALDAPQRKQISARGVEIDYVLHIHVYHLHMRIYKKI